MAPIISDGRTIALGDSLPLVIAATHSRGMAVACLTDLAPHWSGSLSDWGNEQLTLSTGNQVGSDYPGFLKLLLEASA